MGDALTPKQRMLMDFIRSYHQQHLCTPTMQEMSDALAISKPTIFEHINALVARGWLRKSRANSARGLEIVGEDSVLRSAVLACIAAAFTGASMTDPIGHRVTDLKDAVTKLPTA